MMKPVAASPEHRAPIRSHTVSFVPVIRKTAAMPGSAAWDTTSPSRLCRRSTAKLPIIPLAIPSRAAPSATTWKV